MFYGPKDKDATTQCFMAIATALAEAHAKDVSPRAVSAKASEATTPVHRTLLEQATRDFKCCIKADTAPRPSEK